MAGTSKGSSELAESKSSPSFLTVPELAAWLRVPISCVYEWTRMTGADAIPAYRAGKRLVFDPDEALKWFKAMRRHQLQAVDRRRKVTRA